MENKIRIALVGKPNVGKTSIFNQLTGANQKVGNYPGITVEKKVGFIKKNHTTIEIIDLPGTYSLFPSSKDEEVVFNILADQNNLSHPDKVLVVADATNLKQCLLLYEQVRDLGIPTALIINMIDEAERKNKVLNIEKLKQELKTANIFLTSARKKTGINELKAGLYHNFNTTPDFKPPFQFQKNIQHIQNYFGLSNPYTAWQYLAQKNIPYLNKEQKEFLHQFCKEEKIIPKRLQVKETIDRYTQIDSILAQTVHTKEGYKNNSLTEKLDKILVHKFWGFLIFFFILLFVFQVLYNFSSIPMDWIDSIFGQFSNWISEHLPAGPINSLVTEGIIPGISGVIIFIPQIAILFTLLALMEESGYMSRVVFMMDRIMRPFGLSGKSIVPLISGAACAIPAVMAARTIENQKERLISILVTPFMTCSARLPVYAFIITIIIPDTQYGLIGLRAIVLMMMYLLGIAMAFLVALILKFTLKNDYKSFLIFELPNYKLPLWKNIVQSVWEKVKSFVWGAGQIIFAVTILLWFLGTHGPYESYGAIDKKIRLNLNLKGFDTSQQEFINNTYNTILKENLNFSTTQRDSLKISIEETQIEKIIQAEKLQQSYLGYCGRAIEPVVKPLGYDWKIGIGIIASIAAREVFVGTIASIYSLGSEAEEDYQSLKTRLEHEINHNTGKPVINIASGFSLLIFYAFAMQCISTLATVRRETKTWKWPFLQLIGMTGIAYIIAYWVYQFLK